MEIFASIKDLPIRQDVLDQYATAHDTIHRKWYQEKDSIDKLMQSSGAASRRASTALICAHCRSELLQFAKFCHTCGKDTSQRQEIQITNDAKITVENQGHKHKRHHRHHKRSHGRRSEQGSHISSAYSRRATSTQRSASVASGRTASENEENVATNIADPKIDSEQINRANKGSRQVRAAIHGRPDSAETNDWIQKWNEGKVKPRSYKKALGDSRSVFLLDGYTHADLDKQATMVMAKDGDGKYFNEVAMPSEVSTFIKRGVWPKEKFLNHGNLILGADSNEWEQNTLKTMSHLGYTDHGQQQVAKPFKPAATDQVQFEDGSAERPKWESIAHTSFVRHENAKKREIMRPKRGDRPLISW